MKSINNVNVSRYVLWKVILLVSMFYRGICVDRLRNTTINMSRQTVTRCLPSANPECYRYTKLVG